MTKTFGIPVGATAVPGLHTHDHDPRLRQPSPSTPSRRAPKPSQSAPAWRAELVEMDDDEAAAMREELEIPKSGLTTVINGAFSLLNLITFFTVGDEIGQSWHMTNGGTVYDAAGEIHTDIQQGFVRAEVLGYQDLIDAGGYTGARDKGTLRLEGRDYLMQDGDVITVKHTN